MELKEIVERSGGRWTGPGPPRHALVAELGTDSRTIGASSVFVALSGKRFDGHAHVLEAMRRGALSSIVSEARLADLPASVGPYIAVDDPLTALERLARWNRDRLDMKVVAVTGSVGKTSTKEFIATILGAQFRVRSAPKSFNNRLGVATTLLSADPRTQVLVAELGTSGPGEISRLSRLVRPHTVVITEIAPAHLDGLGSLDGVISAKAEIFDGLVQGGTTVLRHGIEGFERFSSRAVGPVITFGWAIGEAPGAGPGPAFAVTDCERTTLGQDPSRGSGSSEYGYRFTINGAESFLLPVPGRHNVLNAAAAIAVARDMGVPWELIRQAIASCRLPPLRLQVAEESGFVFVDDSYNANPASMAAAISEWQSLRDGLSPGRSSPEERAGGPDRGASMVAVLGDMLEMGGDSRSLHEQVGRRLASAGARLVVTVGTDSEWIARACLAEGGLLETVHFPLAGDALPFLKDNLQTGDRILFKGSRGIGLDVLVKDLRTWARARS
ncbi:MAG TPA: UDP-N-acetylmuramoyl-tripeptide--D-alanyl-D-alanine ligase [Planctomycetota bacterium]|nr:UDP-N-acetylmuramoyl-tripeptide--D-alanyl-D-alanine ligase [Planctomycetota bacterium]